MTSPRTYADMANEILSDEDKARLAAIQNGTYAEYHEKKRLQYNRDVENLQEMCEQHIHKRKGAISVSPLALFRLLEELLEC